MANELDVLAPIPEKLTLSTGTEVQLLDLKAQQFFKLLKILTHGPALQALGNSNVLSGTADEIVGKLMGFLIVSIPDAFDETVQFLHSMVQPVGLVPEVDKASQQHNLNLKASVAAELANPELEDVVDLVHAIIKRESADLAALGKKVASLFSLAKKTGQLNPNTPQTSPAQSTSEASAEPTTSSVAPTDGPTSTLPTSPSVEYDNAPQPLPNIPTS